MSVRVTATINVEHFDDKIEVVSSSVDPTSHIIWLGADGTLLFSTEKLVEMHEKIGAYLEACREEDLSEGEREIRIEETWVYPPPERAVA